MVAPDRRAVLLGVALAGLAGAVSLWVWRQTPPPCPGRYLAEPERAARITSLLRTRPAGRPLLAGPPAALCFGPRRSPGVVTEAGVVLLDRSLGDAEAAARLGHLLQHRADGPLAPSAPCAVWVARALRAEARAWTVELSLRRELGVTEPSWRFPFEDAYRAAAAGQGAEVVHRWLVEHPDGAPGVPGVAAAYAARCEAAVGPPPRSP